MTFALKLLVSALLLYLLFSSLDVDNLLSTSAKIPWYLFVLATLSYFVATFFATARWNTLLTSVGVRIPFTRLFLYNFSYTFYSLALPGGKMAAEGMRLYQVISDSKDPDMKPKLVAPSLIDRAFGAFVSLLLSIFYFFFVAAGDTGTFPPWLPYAGLASVALLIASIMFPFERFFGMGSTEGSSISGSVFLSLRSFRSKPAALVQSVLFSVLVNAGCTFGVFFIALGVGLHVNYFMLYLIYSVGMASSFLPISVGGIGAREGIIAYLLSVSLGVPLEIGAAVSISALAASMVPIVIAIPIEIRRHFFRKT